MVDVCLDLSGEKEFLLSPTFCLDRLTKKLFLSVVVNLSSFQPLALCLIELDKGINLFNLIELPSILTLSLMDLMKD